MTETPLTRQQRAELCAHLSAELNKAANALDQVHADLVSLGWQGEEFVNRQSGRRVKIDYASAVMNTLWRNLLDAKPCAYDGCKERALFSCESCDLAVCDDHGSRGGDRRGMAYPAACWLHGGFNADA